MYFLSIFYFQHPHDLSESHDIIGSSYLGLYKVIFIYFGHFGYSSGQKWYNQNVEFSKKLLIFDGKIKQKLLFFSKTIDFL